MHMECLAPTQWAAQESLSGLPRPSSLHLRTPSECKPPFSMALPAISEPVF